MEFKEKQYDGPYQVSEIEITNEDQLFRGILYFPKDSYIKPYDLIIYFHDFPQLFPLKEIVKEHQYLLESGFAFLVCNLRGYRFSEGKLSLASQLSDALKIIQLVLLMSEKGIFNIHQINILTHGFGSYVALMLCSQIKLLNKVLLLSPILDLEKHVYEYNFSQSLEYINRFLPGSIHGIENVNKFIENTKLELKNKQYQIKEFIKHIKYQKLKIIIGELDKITPVREVKQFFPKRFKNIDITVISNMDHDCVEDHHFQKIRDEIMSFFTI